MTNRTAIEVANNSLTELSMLLALYAPFENLQVEVQEEGDDLVIINFEGEDMFIEVRMEEEPTICNAVMLRPKFVPGIYQHHGGYGLNPPEVSEIHFNEYGSLTQAVAKLVATDFEQRAEGVAEELAAEQWRQEEELARQWREGNRVREE